MFSILVDRIAMVEKDEDVVAVWQAILNGGAKWLADEIAHFQLSPESSRAAIARTDESLDCRAFATILNSSQDLGWLKMRSSC